MEIEWKQVRAQFPAVAERAYLDTASYGPGPLPVVEATRRALEDWSSGRGSWRAWERSGEEARARFATLLGVAPSDVALLPTVSIAAAQVAASLADAARPANVVVGEAEFRSNLFPWLALARRGVATRAVPFRGPRLVAEDLAAAVDDDTALVAVSSVRLAPGWKTPADPYAAYYGPPYAPAPDATRFDQSLAWPCWVGAEAALGLLSELGAEPVERRALALADAFRDALAARGVAASFPPAERSQIVSLEVPDATALEAALAERGVVAAVRHGRLRLSFHFFNDEHDVERALAALADSGVPGR